MVSESDFIAAFQAYHDALEDPAAQIDTIRPLVNDHLEQLIVRLPGTVVQKAARDRAMAELDRIEGMAKEQSVELAAEAQRLEGEVREKAESLRGATLFVEPAEPEEGSPFTVGFSGSSGSEHAWIGIFPEGSPNTEHGANWLYVGGSQHPGEAKTAGSLEFGGEQYVAGDYEARLFRNGAHDLMATTSFSISTTESEEFEDEIRARTMGHEEDAGSEVVGEESSDKMRDAFNLFDRDGNGVIDVRELGLMMNALGENMSPDEVGNMLAEADADGDGVINFEEFKVIMSMDRSVYASDPSDVEEEVVEEEDVPEEPASEPETSSTSGSIADVIAHLDTLKLFGAKRRYIESLSSEVFDFNLTIESMDKTIGIGLSDEFRGGHTCIGTVDGIGVGVRMPNTMELEIGQEIYVEAKLLEYRSVVKRFEFEQL